VSSNLTASARIPTNTGLSARFSFLPVKEPAELKSIVHARQAVHHATS
jgi:hypothetical protein